MTTFPQVRAYIEAQCDEYNARCNVQPTDFGGADASRFTDADVAHLAEQLQFTADLAAPCPCSDPHCPRHMNRGWMQIFIERAMSKCITVDLEKFDASRFTTYEEPYDNRMWAKESIAFQSYDHADDRPEFSPIQTTPFRYNGAPVSTSTNTLEIENPTDADRTVELVVLVVGAPFVRRLLTLQPGWNCVELCRWPAILSSYCIFKVQLYEVDDVDEVGDLDVVVKPTGDSNDGVVKSAVKTELHWRVRRFIWSFSRIIHDAFSHQSNRLLTMETADGTRFRVRDNVYYRMNY